MELGMISPLAYRRMRRHGISLDALRHLLRHGQVEKRLDGARLVYLACSLSGATRPEAPTRTLYAILDPAGEVLTVERRVRLGT